MRDKKIFLLRSDFIGATKDTVRFVASVRAINLVRALHSFSGAVRYMLEHFVNVCVPPPCGGDNRKKTYDY